MSSTWASVTIQEFEQVTLENGTELFRVSARGPAGDDPGPRPVLITGPGVERTYEPLSSGGDRRGLLRLAYAVATNQIQPSTTFALQLPDGHRIALPAATPGLRRAEAVDRRAHRATAPEPDQRPDDNAAARVPELEQEVRRLRERLAQLTGEHAAALKSVRAVEAERDESGRRAESATAAHHEMRGQAETARAERDRALQQATTLRAERDEAVRRADEARTQHEAAHEAAGTARTERDLVREQAVGVQAERDAALRGAGSAEAERDAARRETEAVQAERDAARRDLEAVRSEREAARGDAARARAERDEALATARAAADAVRAVEAERDSVLRDTSDSRAEHARLSSRLRQHEARFALQRADAKRSQAAFGPGTSSQLRRLESEREQLTSHVRALAELLSVNGDGGLADPRRAAAERISAVRDRAVRAAHEQAESDLERLLADTAP